MALAAWLILFLGAYPLWRAWRGNRRTSLFQAVHWAIAAWGAWVGMMTATVVTGLGPARPGVVYLALSLTGCAGVAVVGARRPGVSAWNFVLLGLLAVMLLPLAENLVTHKPLLDPLRVIFLSATVVLGVLNYLPTRLAPAALLLGAGCGLQIGMLTGQAGQEGVLPLWLLALAPWVALAAWWTRGQPPSEFDHIWLDFRDRFGFLWGQRLREQFNRAADNAGWPVVLRWQGLRVLSGAALSDPQAQQEMVVTLRALLKRFGEEEGTG